MITGSHHINEVDVNEDVIEVADAVIHHDYVHGKGRFNNDIALLRLKTSIIFNDHVSPICLPDHDEVVDGTGGCKVTGWGVTSGEYKVKYK